MANTSGIGTMGSTMTPPNNYAHTTPVMAVDVYPHNGGKFTFTSNATGTGIIEAQIHKNIRDREGGRFHLVIVPGGPSGVDSSTSWTSIIPINSLAIIYASRGGSGRVLMIGVITEIREHQSWNNNSVVRVISLIGMDFTYYFSAFSFYQLTYLGYLQSNFPTGGGGFLLGQFGRAIPGQPQQLASDYLNSVMLGVGNTTTPAVLENTYVTYQGQKFFLKDLYSYWFQYFNESKTFSPYIALAMEVANSDGNWMDKFTSILPWPWYEFFVITATKDDFPNIGLTAGTPITSSLTTFSSTDYSHPSPVQITPQQNIGIANVDAVPAIIGRVNPQPWIMYNTANTSIGTATITSVGALNRDRWDALTTYTLGAYSFIESNVQYSIADTANFFIVTTAATDSMAATTGGVDPTQFAVETIGAIISNNSINTFGFIPKAINTIWWGGQLTRGGPIPDITALGQLLVSKMASYYIPSPYMLHGNVTIPMWLDPLPGSKFTYVPFKDNNTSWTFYIESVTHSFVFGRQATTTLILSRGLQTSEYADNNILAGVLLDNYVRVDGNLVPRSDLSTNVGAYYILHPNPSGTPYVSSPNAIGPGPSGGMWNVGAPTGTAFGTGSSPTSTPQQAFQDAANACPSLASSITALGPEYGSIPAWKMLQALALTESGPKLSQSAVNGNSYGIMQVNSNSVPPPYTLTQIQNDPYINIQAGGIILCQKLSAAGGNLKNALAFYKGYPGGYNDPTPDIYGNFAADLVDKVLGQALVL